MSTSGLSSSNNITPAQLLQQISSIPNVTGSGVPVSTYTQEMQEILTQELTSVPDAELTSFSNQTSALNSLDTALQQLQTSTQSLASAQAWTPVNATSSNQSSFTVSAGNGALVSALSVTVAKLAQSQLTVAGTPLTTVTAAGTFEILGSTGTVLATISVTAGESLTDVITAINEDSSQTGVQAFVMGDNQLAFGGTKTGSTGAFTLVDSSGNFISSLNEKNAETAQDAAVLIGGVTITSSSNTFSNILPSVTLTVLSTGTGTLNISQNTSGIVTAVQNWMTAYNNVIDLANKDTAYTPSTTGASATVGPLSGDANATGVLSQLPNAVNTIISGSELQSLSAVGIVVDPTNGHLEFQSSSGFTVDGQNFGGSLENGQTMFQNAIQSSLSNVEQLFGVVPGTTLKTVIPTSASAGVLFNLNNTIDDFVGFGLDQGSIPEELQSLSTQTSNVNQYLNQVNQTINNRIAIYTSQLNELNASLQQSQSQMSLIDSLFGESSSSSSSTTSSNTSSSSTS